MNTVRCSMATPTRAIGSARRRKASASRNGGLVMTQSTGATARLRIGEVEDLAEAIGVDVRGEDRAEVFRQGSRHVAAAAGRLEAGELPEIAARCDARARSKARVAQGGLGKSSRLSLGSTRCAITACEVFCKLTS